MKNNINRILYRNGIVAIVCLLALASIDVSAQYGYYHAHSSAYPPHNGGENSSTSYYTSRLGFYERNDCRRFLNDYNSYPYLDTTHSMDLKFKTATLYYYYSDDSLLAHKKLRSKDVYHFNKRGELTLILKYDTIGKISDSSIIGYDAHGNRIRISDYDRSMSYDKLQIRNDELFTWDNKNRLVYDSDFEKKNEVTRYDTSQYLISRITYKYDDSNNITYQFTISNTDTVIEYTTYDSKNQLVSNKAYQYKRWTNHAYKYDNNGNEISSITIFNNADTNAILSAFDEGHRRISWQKFHNNKLLEIETSVFNPDSSHATTEETLGDNTGPSCPEDTKIVSLFDTHHDQYSKITTQESNGKLLTTTDIDKYIYNKLGKIISDSEFVTGKSQWHWDRTLTVYKYKYDSRGNRTETNTLGGENLNSNTRKTEIYNEQNNILEEDEYGSCMDTPFKTTVTKYYSDGKTVKEEIVTQGKSVTTSIYGKDTRFLEKTEADKLSVAQWVWEYTEW